MGTTEAALPETTRRGRHLIMCHTGTPDRFIIIHSRFYVQKRTEDFYKEMEQSLLIYWNSWIDGKFKNCNEGKTNLSTWQ